MIKQLFGTMYTVFCAKCLPRLWDEQFEDEAHVRREMEIGSARRISRLELPGHREEHQRDSRVRNCQLGTYLTGEEEPGDESASCQERHDSHSGVDVSATDERDEMEAPARKTIPASQAYTITFGQVYNAVHAYRAGEPPEAIEVTTAGGYAVHPKFARIIDANNGQRYDWQEVHDARPHNLSR